jgi:putative MATE family efflux protein
MQTTESTSLALEQIESEQDRGDAIGSIGEPTLTQTTSHESIWTTLRDAVRGKEHDYTTGPIGKAIILLSVPMILEMAMESLFAVTDIFFVAKLGADAVAVVGFTESILAIIYAMAIGLSIGVTATVARRVGEKNTDAAASVAVQAVVLGLIVSAILGVTGVLLAPTLLKILGASPSVIELGTPFARIMLGGEVTVILLFLANAIFRGAGDAFIAMRVLWLANIFNIVLGPLLIFGVGPFPELGVTGAAVATTTGRGIGMVFALSQLFRSKSRIHVQRKHIRIEPETMIRLLRLSVSGAFQMLIATASWIGLVRVMARFGSTALAGYTIALRIIMFALLPSFGMSNAGATMVGQALGAKNPERAERSVWRAGLYTAIFLGFVGGAFILFAPSIVEFFTNDVAVQRYAVDCLRVVSAGFLFFAYGGVVTQAFNGAGDTWTPTVLNFFIFWLWEIPLAYVLANTLNMGPHGVFLAISIAFSTLAVVSVILFRRGKWKGQVV